MDLASIPGEGWGKDFRRLEAWAIQKHGKTKGQAIAAKFRNLRKMTVKDPDTGKTRRVTDEDLIATGQQNPDTAEFFVGW